MAEEHVTKLRANGSTPQIELRFGFAQYARFEILLWDANGQNPQEIAHGINIDNSPDKFPIGPPATLNGRFLTWQCVIASPTGGPGEHFSQTAVFTQDGANCSNGPFPQGGPLANTVTTFDQTRFVVE